VKPGSQSRHLNSFVHYLFIYMSILFMTPNSISDMQRRDDVLLKNQYEHPEIFETRFSGSQRLLYFIAWRILDSPESVQDAVQNCWLAASRNPPRFEYEGAFRSWLLRVLIDEALAVLRRGKKTSGPTDPPEHVSSEVYRWESGAAIKWESKAPTIAERK
jgi:DNA-directed RNA polymerase specialized sigma24 family protein